MSGPYENFYSIFFAGAILGINLYNIDKQKPENTSDYFRLTLTSVGKSLIYGYFFPLTGWWVLHNACFSDNYYFQRHFVPCSVHGPTKFTDNFKNVISKN